MDKIKLQKVLQEWRSKDKNVMTRYNDNVITREYALMERFELVSGVLNIVLEELVKA